MKSKYYAVLISEDGQEHVTDFPRDTKEEVWAALGDMGSKWLFYPICVIAKTPTEGYYSSKHRVVDAEEPYLELKGKEIRNAKKIIQKRVQELEKSQQDDNTYLNVTNIVREQIENKIKQLLAEKGGRVSIQYYWDESEATEEAVYAYELPVVYMHYENKAQVFHIKEVSLDEQNNILFIGEDTENNTATIESIYIEELIALSKILGI